MAGLLELGPVEVFFGTAGSEVNIGPTEGGVVVKFGADTQNLLTDQAGTTPQEIVISGQPIEVTVPLASISFDNLALALNQTALTAGSCNLIKGTNKTGVSLMATKSKSLLLKKYVTGLPSTSKNDWLRFPKAASKGQFDLDFSKDKQRVIEVTFAVFPDSNNVYYFIGDESTG